MSKKPASKSNAKQLATSSISLSFDDHSLLPMLYGLHDQNLNRIEEKLDVSASSRGNILSLSGEREAVNKSESVVRTLYARLLKGLHVDLPEVDAAIRMSGGDKKGKTMSKRKKIESDIAIKTAKKLITPYSHNQAAYIQALYDHDMVFALGPAGTGKTYLAVAMAVTMFMNKKVERIILSRPAVEAGEKLGFLPGDLKEKIDPYLRPLYDALYDMMPGDRVLRYMETGEIEVAPLAFMRGRTLSNSYIILDEAQNTTPTQMKMFLTRLGENSRMVITGDLSQTDLPKDIMSGLRDAVRKVEHIEGISTIRFADEDVVRHTLAAKIVQAYEEWDKRKKTNGAQTQS